MATIIKIKNSGTSGAPSAVATGELRIHSKMDRKQTGVIVSI